MTEPKPDTVTVTLRREDAEWLVKDHTFSHALRAATDEEFDVYRRVANAVDDALREALS